MYSYGFFYSSLENNPMYFNIYGLIKWIWIQLSYDIWMLAWLYEWRQWRDDSVYEVRMYLCQELLLNIHRGLFYGYV